nr:unnamed protein product [Callosobruchus chinensis]
MQPIQISEPNSSEVIFDIDLGTTNTLVAMVNKAGNVEIFKDEQGRELLPSVISYENNTLKTGCDVGQNAIYSIKRLMGESVEELNKEGLNFEIDNETYFDDSARNATKYAAKLAGIEVLRLVNDPTAAALSYSIEKNNSSLIYAVYDLGGGTFDISILKLHQGVFQVLAVGGDTKLGGDDFDHLLSSIIVLDKYREKTINIVTRTISDIDLKIDDIKGVILVGGATGTPLVQNSLVKLFGNKVLNDVDPDKAVVMGAALQAHDST